VRFAEEVPPLLKRFADVPIGSTVRITYEREGIERHADLTTEKLRRDRGKEKAFRGWGITALEITEKMARDYRLEGTQGVLITSIRDGGPAQLAEPAMTAYDVIRSVDGEAVIMGSNEKKNLIIMYSKFIILFEFIQEVDCHRTIYSSS
jgi:serine protease Do